MAIIKKIDTRGNRVAPEYWRIVRFIEDADARRAEIVFHGYMSAAVRDEEKAARDAHAALVAARAEREAQYAQACAQWRIERDQYVPDDEGSTPPLPPRPLFEPEIIAPGSMEAGTLTVIVSGAAFSRGMTDARKYEAAMLDAQFAGGVAG